MVIRSMTEIQVMVKPMTSLPAAAMPVMAVVAMPTMPAEVERRQELVKMGRLQWK